MHRWLLPIALAGCHVTARDQITRPIATERIQHAEGAIALPPTLVLTDAGQLRFVEPLECPTEEVVTQLAATEIRTGPNLATFVVGIVATAVGGVLTVRGLSDDAPASSPFLYGGLGLAAGGLTFAVGPWIGRRTELVPGETTTLRRPGPSARCGERALAARAATLAVRGLEVHGRIDRDGVFAVSPYQLVDAFAPAASGAWDVRATIDAAGGPRTVRIMLDAGALASRARAYLDRAGFDARIEPMRLVPGLVPGPLRASLTSTADGPAVRLIVRLANQGPGPAWAVRGHVIAPGVPAIDGRVLYAGHVAKGGARDLTALVPVSEATAARLRNAHLELSIELHDAHGTAPATPIRFRGPLLGDAPR